MVVGIIVVAMLLGALIWMMSDSSSQPKKKAAAKPENNAYRAWSRYWPSKDNKVEAVDVDSKFHDRELDLLINDGDYSKARAYLRDMQKIAREMSDAKTLADYSDYDARITAAAASPDRAGLRRTGAESHLRK